MAYNGYLLKFGNVKLPNKYLVTNSYNATPNQRTELSAYRDNNNLLHRATSPNFKTKIEFTIVPMTLEEKRTVQGIILNAVTNRIERKSPVTYWNDETNSYVTGNFYIPDVTYPIMDANSKSILYGATAYTLIEY